MRLHGVHRMPRAESMPGQTHPAEVIHSVFERSMPSDLIRGWDPVRVKKTRQKRKQPFRAQGAGVTMMVLFSVLDSIWPIALAMVRVRSLTLRVMPPSTSKVVRSSSDSAIDLTTLSI